MFESPKRWPRSSSWLLTLSYLVYPVSIIVLLVSGGIIVQQQHVVFFPSNASQDEASHQQNRNPPTPVPKPKEDDTTTTTTTTSRETSATNKVVQLMALLRQPPPQPRAVAPRDVVDDRRMEMDGTKTPPCDTTLLWIPQQEIAAAFDTVVASLAEEYQLGFFTVWGLKLLFATKKKYGIELRKVCTFHRSSIRLFLPLRSPVLSRTKSSDLCFNRMIPVLLFLYSLILRRSIYYTIIRSHFFFFLIIPLLRFLSVFVLLYRCHLPYQILRRCLVSGPTPTTTTMGGGK